MQHVQSVIIDAVPSSEAAVAIKQSGTCSYVGLQTPGTPFLCTSCLMALEWHCAADVQVLPVPSHCQCCLSWQAAVWLLTEWELLQEP